MKRETNTMTPEQAAEKEAEKLALNTDIKMKDLVGLFLAGHAHAENRWVKVSGNGMPKENGDYYVFTGSKIKPNVFLLCYMVDNNRWFYSSGNAFELNVHSYSLHVNPQPPEHG